MNWIVIAAKQRSKLQRTGTTRNAGSVILLLTGLITSIVSCGGGSTADHESTAPLRPVKVLEVTSGSNTKQRVLASTVISADSQDLSFRIGGAITSLPVAVGDRLEAGALVATLDQQPFKLAEKEAQAALAQADANYRNAASQYQRTRDLYSTEAASLADLENTKATASSARANRALAQEGLNSARLNLGYSQLTSPSDNCQIVSVPIALNQNISAGQTIVTTACGSRMRLRTIVPESLINELNIGMPVTATAQSDSSPLQGKVIEIAVSSGDGSGYAVEVELESPPPALKVGMAAEITFDLAVESERILVPLTAVMSNSNETFVFVAKPVDDYYQIERVAVETGELDNEGIEIVSGLVLGQQVVTAGMSRISEGMNVTLYSPTQP